MRRIQKHRSASIDWVQLDLDDLFAIHEVMSSQEGEIDIELNDFQIDNINELEDLKVERVERFLIKRHKPYVSLEVSRKSTWLYCSGDDNSGLGIFAMIEEILLSRRDPWRYLKSDRIWLTASMPMLGAVIGLILNLPHPSEMGRFEFYSALSLTGVALITALLGANSLLLIWTHNRILLVRRSEQKSFLKRNKDSLALILLTAVITTIVSVGGTLLVQQLNDPPSIDSAVQEDEG